MVRSNDYEVDLRWPPGRCRTVPGAGHSRVFPEAHPTIRVARGRGARVGSTRERGSHSFDYAVFVLRSAGTQCLVERTIGGRQPGEPAAGGAFIRAERTPGGGGLRARGVGGDGEVEFRPCAHGRLNIRDGRVRGDRGHSGKRKRDRSASGSGGFDGAGHERGSQETPGGRDGRLTHNANSAAGPRNMP